MANTGDAYELPQYTPGVSMKDGTTPAVVVPPALNIGSANAQILHGAFANPNGNVTPNNTSDAADYYQDSVPLNRWSWDVPSQAWKAYITP
jgi:hypothetical protein